MASEQVNGNSKVTEVSGEVNIHVKQTEPKIILPSEPFQIAKTKENEPIWVDPKDVLLTPDEQAELSGGLTAQKTTGALQRVARKIAQKKNEWIGQRLLSMMPNDVLEKHKAGNLDAVQAWLNQEGFEWLNDFDRKAGEFVTVLLRKKTEISRFIVKLKSVREEASRDGGGN